MLRVVVYCVLLLITCVHYWYHSKRNCYITTNTHYSTILHAI